MSDIMSDMKRNEEEGVYTVRDLNRRTAEVLAEAAKLGSVTIRSRSGERFVLKPEAGPGEPPRRVPDFAARRKQLEQLGYVPPPPGMDDWINGIITGDL
jgi:hypothetical protein